jgi:hypothetical protein
MAHKRNLLPLPTGAQDALALHFFGRLSLFLHHICVRVPSTQMSLLKCRWSACIACIGVVQYIYFQLGALSFTGT